LRQKIRFVLDGLLQLLIFLKSLLHVWEGLAALVGVMQSLNLLIAALELLKQLPVLLLQLSLHMGKLFGIRLELFYSLISSPQFLRPCLLLVPEVLIHLEVHIWITVLIKCIRQMELST